MEFVSVCPLRLGASLTVRGHAFELKVVVKATLEPALLSGDGGALELAEHQLAPEGAERAQVDDEAAVSRAVRRLPGVEVARRRWSFGGAPPGMEVQELPEISPRLFISHAGASREVMLGTHAVEVNPVTGWVTVLWTGAVPLARAETDGTLVLAMERNDELVTLPDVMQCTRGLDPAFVEQRGRAVVRGLATSEFPPLPTSPEASPPKRSIGQRMLDAPPPPMARRSPRPEPEDVAPARAEARRTLRGHEVIWVADGAEAALRRYPTFRQLLPKKSGDEEADRSVAGVGVVALRGAVTALEDLSAALRGAVSDGMLEPPLVLVEGELSVIVDAVEVLRAWGVNALAVAPNDESVKVSVAAADAVDLADAPTAHVASLLAAVRVAVSAAVGATVAATLDVAIRRGLARARRTERVALHLDGEGEHVRAVLSAPATRPTSPPRGTSGPPERGEARVYLPADAAEKLPLLTSLEARLLARVRPPLEGRASRAPVLLPLAILRAFTVEVDAHSTPGAAPARSVTP